MQAVEAEGFDYLLAFDHVLGVNVEERPDWDPLNVLRDVAARAVHGKRSVEQERMIKRAPYDLPECVSGADGALRLPVWRDPQHRTGNGRGDSSSAADRTAGQTGGQRRESQQRTASPGRVGIGWNDAEYEALGMDFRTRGRRSEEQLVFLRRLWSEETVTFRGEFDRIRGAGINPRPKRPIPLWLGGNSRSRHAACRPAGRRLAAGASLLRKPKRRLRTSGSRSGQRAAILTKSGWKA